MNAGILPKKTWQRDFNCTTDVPDFKDPLHSFVRLLSFMDPFAYARRRSDIHLLYRKVYKCYHSYN